MSFGIAAWVFMMGTQAFSASGADVSNLPIGEIIQSAIADTYTATSGIVTTKTIINDPEFDVALQRMYNTQITKYNTQETYSPFNMVTREQAAKMLAQFFSTYVQDPQRIDISNCQFTDTTNTDPTLKPYILDACQFTIFKGSNGLFAPSRTITKAELSAALIRMFSDGHLDETASPWWSNYFVKAQELGMTKETVMSRFQNPVSRYELALILHRFKKIYADEEPIQPITYTSWSTTSGTITTTGSTTLTSGEALLSLIGWGASVTDSVEFKETVRWMFDNGLTKFSGTTEFMPFDVLTRAQAAKMLVQYRNIMFPGKVAVSPGNCTFTDIGLADPSLSGWIQQSCKLNILKGWDGYFNPEKSLTRPEAIAVLLRMFDQPQDETPSPRWTNYFTKAQQLGLISDTSSVNFDKPITRYEMSTLMYRLKVKNGLVQSLNSDVMQNKLITMINNSKQLITNTGDRARGYIIMNSYLLEDQASDYFLIDLFGTTYRIAKNTIRNYFDKQYVWYGDVFTLDGSTKVGIANFVINDTVVLEGTIRPYGDGKPSYILWPASTTPYYILKELIPLQPGYSTTTSTSLETTGAVNADTGSNIQ